MMPSTCRKRLRPKTALYKWRSPAIAIGLVLDATLFGMPLRAEDVTFSDFPFLVFCEDNGVHHAYYLSKLGPEGNALYITPDRLVGSISAKGVAKRLSGGKAGNCAGKTLEELRSAGQAFDLPH
jgi:hypothetical protein